MQMASCVETDEHTSPTSKSIQCTTDGCPEQFKKKSQLRQHLFDVHGDIAAIKPYECQICKRKFQTNSHLKRHAKVHNGYKCETCKLTYNTWSELRKHRAETHKPFSVKCEACRAQFQTRADLNIHKESCEEKAKLKCEICKKTFFKKENLKKHLKTVHHCQRDYSCVNCNKEFLHAHNVVNHLALCFARSEEGLLDQSAFTSENLREVITSSLKEGRSDEYEFQCNECRKRFKYRRSLWRHQKKNCPMLEHADKNVRNGSDLFGGVGLGFEPRSRPVIQTDDGSQLNWDESPVVKIVKLSHERTGSLMDERNMSSDCEREEHSRSKTSSSSKELLQQSGIQKSLSLESNSLSILADSSTEREPETPLREPETPLKELETPLREPETQLEPSKARQESPGSELVMPELIKYKERNRITT